VDVQPPDTHSFYRVALTLLRSIAVIGLPPQS